MPAPMWPAASDVEQMVAHPVELFGRVDVAHNNAGVPGPYQPLWE